MAFPTVHVTAPSRLHFGMLSFGRADVPQYGGVGMMVDVPAVKLRISPSLGSDWEFCGPGADRAESFASRWARTSRRDNSRGCRIEIQQLPPPHTGLGSGTQMALSVAAGLNRFFDLVEPSPCELARSVGRAARSTVGTYGFRHGGLIFESGKPAPEENAVLESQLPIRETWQVVLIRASRTTGIFGKTENDAFVQLPPVPPEITASLRAEVTDRMLPAAATSDFDTFSQSVYTYGRIAGNCFSSVQDGPYAGPELSDIVRMLRDWGIRGVGQSSWGPTLFALLPDLNAATTLVTRIRSEFRDIVCELSVSRPNNSGATIRANPGDCEEPTGQ